MADGKHRRKDENTDDDPTQGSKSGDLNDEK